MKARLLLGTLLVVGCGDAPLGGGQLGDQLGDEHVAQAESAVVVCPSGDTLEGIDVSYYQGSIDWPAAAADGLSFAIARVNHGSFMDPEFDTNWQGIAAQGLIRGAYQYFDPGGDPVAQAQVFIDRVGVLGPGDLPGVIDVESTDGLGPAAIAANVATWIELVTAGTGRAPIIYTGSYYWNDNVQTDMFADHPLWIAHYTTACPNVPTAWSNFALWQYTSSGAVAGIAGNVDRNVFNGGIEELHDLAGNGLRARVVSVDHPATMKPGASATVTLVLENLGARTWTANTKIGTTMPRDRASVFAAPSWASDNRAAEMPLDVPTGDTVTVSFDIVAPAEVGHHVEHINLVEEGFAWFSDTPPGGEPTDDTIALSITVDGDIAAGGADGAGGDDAVLVIYALQGKGSGCSVSAYRTPRDGMWWLLALSLLALRLAAHRLSAIATTARRRSRRPARSHR